MSAFIVGAGFVVGGLAIIIQALRGVYYKKDRRYAFFVGIAMIGAGLLTIVEAPH